MNLYRVKIFHALAFIMIGLTIGIRVYADPGPDTKQQDAASPSQEGPRANDVEDFQSEEDLESGGGEEAPPEVKPKKRPAGGGSSAKEAEGSKAPNRFKAGIVTKSYYRLDGESLEVDPD